MDIISPNTSTSESPLQRFPIEMLCEAFAAIIAHYRQAIDDARHVKEVKLQHPSITLSHVCRTWRETSIAAPTLWRRIYIPGLSHKLVDLYLERSKESTLALRIDYMPRQHKRAVESAVKTLNYMTRIGELCLVTEDRFARYYVHYLERPAPRLKLLALHIDPVHSMHYASRPQLEHKILNNIEKSPLRTLRLHSIIAPWTSSIFHGLTSLSIEFPTTSLTITELLDILDSTPDLVHMTYRDRCIRDTPMVHSPPYRRISLPRLLSLQLEMFCDDLECLCDNILMSSLVSWRFKAKCDQPTRSPRHPSRSFPFSEQIHSLVITASYYHTELLFAAKSPSHSDHPCNETILTSSLGYHEPTCHPVQVVAANIKSHSSAHLLYVSFTIRWVRDDSPVYWAELLACFPKVRTLTLNTSGTGTENFAMAFMKRSNDHSPHFHCSELSRHNIETDMSEHKWDQMAGLLNTCLSFRIQHHLPKIDLHVKDCSDFIIRPAFMAHHARVLEPVVNSLTWESHPDDPLCIDRMGLDI